MVILIHYACPIIGTTTSFVSWTWTGDRKKWDMTKHTYTNIYLSGHSEKTTRQLSLPVVYQTTHTTSTHNHRSRTIILQTKRDKWMDIKKENSYK